MVRTHMNRWVNFGGIGPQGRGVSEFPLMDDDRSQYPYDLASGYGVLSATTLFTSILLPAFASGTSVVNYWFKPETLIITNNNGAANRLIIYDGQSASAGVRQALDITIKASDTIFIGKDYLRGMFFVSGVYVSNLLSGITIRIGGKLMESIAAQL